MEFSIDPRGLQYFHDDQLIYTGNLIAATSVDQIVFSHDNFEAPDETGDFDNLSVKVVPEPTVAAVFFLLMTIAHCRCRRGADDLSVDHASENMPATVEALHYAPSRASTIDDTTWVPSRRWWGIIGTAVSSMFALVWWAEAGIRYALTHEPWPALDLMPNQAHYTQRYISAPMLAGTIIDVVLGLIVCVQVLRARWPARSLLLLIGVFVTWLMLIICIISIEHRAMT